MLVAGCFGKGGGGGQEKASASVQRTLCMKKLICESSERLQIDFSMRDVE